MVSGVNTIRSGLIVRASIAYKTPKRGSATSVSAACTASQTRIKSPNQIHSARDCHFAWTNKRGADHLIVDDMGLIMTLLKRELEPRGFKVWLAVDGNDALDVYWRNRAQIDLVLLDVQMPDLDGPQTLAHLQQLDPNVVACFMTGDPGIYTEEDLLNRGATHVFKKPFRLADLADLVQRLVSTPHPTPFICDEQVSASVNAAARFEAGS